MATRYLLLGPKIRPSQHDTREGLGQPSLVGRRAAPGRHNFAPDVDERHES